MTSLYILPDSDYIKEFYNTRTNYSTDAGVDLYTPLDVTFYPGETKLVDLGIKCKMIDSKDNAIAYYLYPRSSICNTPLRLVNSVGIIDKEYRGNIKAALQYIPSDSFLKNILSYNTNDENDYMETHSFTLKKTQKIVQLCAPDLNPLKIVLVEQLDDTIRGSGGFGSTN